MAMVDSCYVNVVYDNCNSFSKYGYLIVVVVVVVFFHVFFLIVFLVGNISIFSTVLHKFLTQIIVIHVPYPIWADFQHLHNEYCENIPIFLFCKLFRTLCTFETFHFESFQSCFLRENHSMLSNDCWTTLNTFFCCSVRIPSCGQLWSTAISNVSLNIVATKSGK